METVEEEMKWLIVGGGGQLGRAMQTELAEAESEFVSLDQKELDITNEKSVESAFRDIDPDVVINAAAWTNVDEAENSEAEAALTNSYGAGLLAKACSKHSSRFVHISTDYVFSGKSKNPWPEAAILAPTSAYGRTKAEGERLVLDLYPIGSYIIRTGWLYSPWGKNFAKTMVRLALRDENIVEVVSDQVGQPTSALDLAARIRGMIEKGVAVGIYHGTNSGEATWFEFAQSIFGLVGTDSGRVIPVSTSQFQQLAKRPEYSVLGHQGWIEAGMSPMRGWRAALAEALPSIIDVVKLEG